ncbi:MAG TPA: hypothetical protein VH988_17105 [Thermoanaerobaculia bacterium]|jgi:hypothetical protein|nr:hypothetical protein [Thermoanaerobaculia bacterium]
MENLIRSPIRWARLSTVLLSALLSLAAAESVDPIGEVVRVRGALGSFRDGESHSIEVTESLPLGITVTLGATRSFIISSLKTPVFAKTGGARILNWGSLTFKGIGEFTIEKAEVPAPESESKPTTDKILLDLLVPKQGRLWMALDKDVPHKVSVQTPQLKAISGTTFFRMLVDPAVGTFLATDEGEVRADLPTGESFRVTAGHWLLVPPKGTIQRGANDHLPDSLEDPPLLDCCDFRTGSQIP